MTMSAQDWRSIQKTNVSLLALQKHRPVTWKEASRMLRYIDRRPSIVRYYGKAVLVGDFYGDPQRIVSMSTLQSMTPAQFWQRLRHVDYYRAAITTTIRW